MGCLELSELRALSDAETALLEASARKIENIVADAKEAAQQSGLDLALIQNGLITVLILTTANFAALHNESDDKETVSFSIMRCMAEALLEITTLTPQDGLGKRH
ncbi:MAG: hypothetical protein WAK01_06045 [Methylocystis sp.]